MSSSLFDELDALASLAAQLARCESALRQRHVPRVAVLAWLTRRAASLHHHHHNAADDAAQLAAWLTASLAALVVPADALRTPQPPRALALAAVPAEAAALLVACGSALAVSSADGAVDRFVTHLWAPLLAASSVLVWPLVSSTLAERAARSLLDGVVFNAPAAALLADAHTRWCVALLAAALAPPAAAALAADVARALVDATLVRVQRPVHDLLLLLAACPPLAAAAVPALSAFLRDGAALRAVLAANAQVLTLADLVDAVAAAADSWLPLAPDALAACERALADPLLAPLAAAALRGVLVRLAGVAAVSSAPPPLLAALREPALALLLPRLRTSDGIAFLEATLALVAGTRDDAAALAATLAAAAQPPLFATLLEHWAAGVFPRLPHAVLGAALAARDDAVLLLLQRVAAPANAGGRSLRAAVRADVDALLGRVADADRDEPVAVRAVALLRAAFAAADEPDRDAFGDAPADAQVGRARVLHAALDLLRLAAEDESAVKAAELLKRVVVDVVLVGVESSAPICAVAVDALVACVAPLDDERRLPVRSTGAARPPTAGSLLLAACERHKRARVHAGAAAANSAATVFSGKEFVKPTPRAPRPAALSAVTAPAFEAGDAIAQHAFDLLARVCAVDERARLPLVRRSLAFRAGVAAGVLPLANGNNGHAAHSGAAAGAGAPQTPAHEPPVSLPSTPARDSMQVDAAAAAPPPPEAPTNQLSCAWTTAGVPGGDAVGHTTARRLVEWLNESPRALDLLQLLARVPGECQQERVLVLLVQSALAIHGRRVASPARSVLEVRRLAALCRQLGWTTPALAALAEQCVADDVRAIMAALRDTLGDADAANARAAALSASALEHGAWQAVFRAQSS